jgi:hypothetical protein
MSVTCISTSISTTSPNTQPLDDAQLRSRSQPSRTPVANSPTSASGVEGLAPNIDKDHLSAVSDPESFKDDLQGAVQCIKRKWQRTELAPDGSYLEPRKRARIAETPVQDAALAEEPVATTRTASSPPKTSGGRQPRKLFARRIATGTSPYPPPKRSILAVPDERLTPPRSSPPKPALAVQPLSSPPRVQQPRCDHPRHPAYYGEYMAAQCPRCRLERYVTDIQAATARIMKHSGVHPWLESCIDALESGQSQMSPYAEWEASTRGCSGDGKYASHRHCKQRLHTLLPKLELLAEKERIWDEDIAAGISGNEKKMDTNLAKHREHTVMQALEIYKAEAAVESFTSVERTSAIFMHERGRELAIATDPNYPVDNDASTHTHKLNRKTPAQTKFVYDSHMPPATGGGAPYESIDAPSKRKLRRHGLKVSFDDQVKVCADSDIDVLRKYATTAATLQSDPCAVKSDLYTEPRLAYFTRKIRPEDAPARRDDEFTRKKQSYVPGTWAPSEGTITINTCGVKALARRKKYYSELQAEAEQLDSTDEELRAQESCLIFLRVSARVKRAKKGALPPAGSGFGSGIIAPPFASMRRQWAGMREE